MKEYRNPDRTAHPIVPTLPAHWEGITLRQSTAERAAAIRMNVALDNAKRANGIDPMTGNPGTTAQRALWLAKRLTGR
jgi:hypothetical protein